MQTILLLGCEKCYDWPVNQLKKSGRTVEMKTERFHHLPETSSSASTNKNKGGANAV